jgi:plastocyanin
MDTRPVLLIAVVAAISAYTADATSGSIHGRVTCRSLRDCTGALVYVERIPGRTFPSGLAATMDQLALTFVPHVLPVVVGTKVAFPNSDEVRHNVFSVSPAKRFNLGTYPRGVTRYMVFDRPGVVELLCNVHMEMSAYVVVLETPYVTEVAADGTYAIADAPAGTYVIAAWHPRLERQRREVSVSGDEAVAVDFDLR